ncbi:cysteine-rich receptor-like protein kinase 25 [Quercus suber]|uniref:Cysteine-rich receptor-like protein kinase 25 n=1 Tax=Quercus suber TaxID=58331 RepID=A0AAW0JVT7_QUESU
MAKETKLEFGKCIGCLRTLTLRNLPSFHVSMIILVLLYLLSSIISEAAPTYRSHYCSDATFTPNSTYQSNLNLVLSSLFSNSSIESGFYNITVGQNSSNNKIYGLFLCRRDVTTEVCQDCVATATKNTVQQYCPRRRAVVIWYDECMLRYSKPNFFIIMDDPSFSKWDNSTVAECTPDISSFDCNKCLWGAIAYLPSCCSGKQGAMGLYTSCSVRYDVHPFYRIIPSPPVPPPPPSPPVLVTRTHNCNSKTHYSKC